VGGVTAHCAKCGAHEFVLGKHVARDVSITLVCVKCGTETPRRALVDQIGEEIMKRANEALEKARKWRAVGKDKEK
jgi:predicted nucleic-acid-binding Zn-ribbon protein